MKPKILIMAGGTGGHIFPALAVADYLTAEQWEVVWLGTPNSMEAKIIPNAGYAMEWVTIRGVRGKGCLAWVGLPMKFAKAVYQVIGILHRHQPNIVLGMGGFVSAPGGMASWLLNIPLLIHEQNAISGLSNRLLSHFATCTLTAFPQSFKPQARVSVLGNPVRATLLDWDSPKQRGLARRERLHVLVMGGSLGALVFNHTLPKVFQQLAQQGFKLDIWHQTGEKHFEIAKQCYQDCDLKVNLVAFMTDMAVAYAWADMIICRAGALTIAEIANIGLAAILVPYPYAVDDHQTANAKFLTEQGAGILLPQTEFKVETVLKILSDLCAKPETIVAMAEKAYTLAQPQATKNIVKYCEDYRIKH